MTAAAIAADIVRKAMKLPQKRVRLCQYDRAFCASCPDAERLPCVLAGGYWDCETCTASGCPCMALPTSKRQATHVKWKENHDAANAKTDERGRKYRHKRWRDREKSAMKHYQDGRMCADCGKPITNRNASGYCRSCSGQRRQA